MFRQLQQSSRLVALRWTCSPYTPSKDPRVTVACATFRHFTTDIETGGSVYVTDLENEGQISPILIGLVDYFQRHVPNVGFFQPVAGDPFPHSSTGLPRHIELLKSTFKLPGDPHRMCGVTIREAVSLVASGKQGELMDRIFTAYDRYKQEFDVVIVEGIKGDNMGSNFLELNADIAATIDSPVLLVSSVRPQESATEIYNRLMINKQEFDGCKADLLGVIINKVPVSDHKIIATQLARKLGRETGGNSVPFIGAIPNDEILASVRLDEVQAALNAKLLFGDESSLDREFGIIYVASATLDTLLEYIEEGEAQHPGVKPLVICSGTRGDVLIGTLASHISGSGPVAAGLIVTGGDKIGRKVMNVVRGLNAHTDTTVPMLTTNLRTFDVTNIISRTADSILPTSQKKIDQAKVLFDTHVDMNPLVDRLAAHAADTVLTPKMFMYNIRKRCMKNPQHVILPESLDKRVLTAAAELSKKGIAKITLLGNPEKVHMQANALDLDISACDVVDHLQSSRIERYVGAVVEARKKRNVTPDMAKDLLSDVNYFATAMVMCGDADGMVSGALHTTANTIRPGLQILRTGGGLVSSVFFMCLPDRILVYGDCAVNVSPTPEQLAQIAITSAETAKAFGIDPKVALLSYSTMGSGSGPEVEKVTEAAEIARELRPDLAIEGPIQYDAAVDPQVAAVKIKTESQVAGQANVCIFPDLNTGNNTYKAVQQSTGAVAIGPLLQGLDKPVNDLSRGCTVADIINTVECTAVQAMQAKGLL